MGGAPIKIFIISHNAQAISCAPLYLFWLSLYWYYIVVSTLLHLIILKADVFFGTSVLAKSLTLIIETKMAWALTTHSYVMTMTGNRTKINILLYTSLLAKSLTSVNEHGTVAHHLSCILNGNITKHTGLACSIARWCETNDYILFFR